MYIYICVCECENYYVIRFDGDVHTMAPTVNANMHSDYYYFAIHKYANMYAFAYFRRKFQKFALTRMWPITVAASHGKKLSEE